MTRAEWFQIHLRYHPYTCRGCRRLTDRRGLCTACSIKPKRLRTWPTR
jgi:hypothetical protein